MIPTLMHFYPIFHLHVSKKKIKRNNKKKCSPFNCADNFLAKSHPPRHQTTARFSTLPRSACRVDPARFQHFPSPTRHALHRAASRRRHYYSLTALLLFSGEDVCIQCIQGKNYNFKTENVITLFTNHNVNRNIVCIFVSLDFRHYTPIVPCFSSYFWRQCLNDNAVTYVLVFPTPSKSKRH